MLDCELKYFSNYLKNIFNQYIICLVKHLISTTQFLHYYTMTLYNTPLTQDHCGWDMPDSNLGPLPHNNFYPYFYSLALTSL